MRLLSRLEKALGPYAIPHLTLCIIAFQVVCYLLVTARPEFAEALTLNAQAVAQGEWWRLLLFVFLPPATSPIFLFFALYMFYLMGTALERHWGTFRYNLYLLVAYVASVGASFGPYLLGQPGSGTNAYIGLSVFLAFAALFPDFVIYLFFFIPVRVKWLALLTWVVFGFMLVTGSWMTRVLIGASVANYLLFFWRDILDHAQIRRQRMHRQIKRIRTQPSGPAEFHRCVVCGATERSHPQFEFRYCPECGGKGYCLEHLRNHQHQRDAMDANQR
jgi:membrane associated rhomboid family serine protease